VSEGGFFAIDRGVWDHPLFAKEKFSEREAWLWMLSAAVWADKRVRVGKSVIDLKRGQLAFATRFLAQKWTWAHSKVVRFLKRLEIDTMVTTLATRDATLITICNYDKYQSGRNASETQTGTPPETPAERQRNKEEENKQSNNKQITKDPPLRSDDWPKDHGDLFWQAYPRKTEKLAAMKKLATLRKSGIVTFVDLMAGVKRYATAVINTDPKYVKQPTTWLNAGCWADETQPGGTNGDRIGNTRTTGHDAILAVAARKARELDRNDDMARPADAPGFAFGDGTNRSGSNGNPDAARADRGNNQREEPDDQRIREGEIIPPDKDVAGIPRRRQFV
jgi:hypothetical protein